MTPDVHAYVLHRSRLVAEAMLANLPAAGSLPYALGPRTTERAGTWVCVGAGPSLEATGPELARMQKAGACILTVNTALSAVSRWVRPDVVIAREVVDVSSHLHWPAGLYVLDIGASPRAWERARNNGPTAWFWPGAPHCFDLAATHGGRPLFGGPAAMTGLVALAEEWGAAEIVLVGCDLALADDGKSYADGSAFAGQRAEIDAHGVATNGGDGFVRKQEQHARGGVEAYPTREATALVERWGGGGMLRTTTQWLPQLEWLRNFAQRHPEIVCIDATGAGTRKGWREVDVREVTVTPASGPVLSAPDPEAMARVLASIEEQRETALAVAVNVLHADGAPECVPGFVRGTDFVDMFAAKGLLLNNEADTSVVAKIRAAYGTVYPDAVRASGRVG